MEQAKSLLIFSGLNNDSVTCALTQDGDTMIAMLREDSKEKLLILSLKEVTKGYYTLAYHLITNEDETSQDFSLPFPANYAPAFVAAIVNDVF
ncbi:hypothetical protein MVUOKPPV_CDS0293 [Klebsiella phage phi1_175008]|uniref:Uncharacterized protein n=1 Tax=Klebsiella phage phi1_175008 TaxID=3127744 RepID=A0ACD5FRJ4_9CAUD